jgi:methionine biosynthesis protein MetW
MNKNNFSNYVKENEEWFDRPNAFYFHDDDLETQIRFQKIDQIIKSILKKKRSKKVRILDLGCGDGKEISIYISKKCEVHGVDIGDNILKESKKRGLITKKHDLSKKLPFKKEYFDIVFAGEVIEHLYDSSMFIKEIERVLKKNGKAIITTPNLAHFPDRIRLLFGKTTTQIQANHIFLKMHIRQFTFDTLLEICDENNLKLDRFESTIVVFTRDNDKVCIHSKIMAKILPRLGYSIIFLLSKKQ